MRVPELRFKEFEEDWEGKKLGDLTVISSGKRLPKNHTFSSYPEIPYISVTSMGGKYINSNKLQYINKETEDLIRNYKVFNGDLIISIAGTLGKINIVDSFFDGANLSENCYKLTKLKNTFPSFIYQYLISDITQKQIIDTQTIGSIPKLALDRFRLFKINTPTLPEQEKIGSFFSVLDEQIEVVGKELELLTQAKKGLMQGIFSQGMRFKDEEGNDYPDWEEKKLGELGLFYNGLSGKSKVDFEIGNSKFITYMNVFKNTLTSKYSLNSVTISENESQNRVNYGDVLFTQSSETLVDVGMCSVWLHNSQPYLNSFCFGYRFNDLETINPSYIAFLMRSPNIRSKISALGQGSTRYNISSRRLLDLYIPLPVLPEQEKIASVLTTMDEKIETLQVKLASLKELKKGLLQQMFV